MPVGMIAFHPFLRRTASEVHGYFKTRTQIQSVPDRLGQLSDSMKAGTVDDGCEAQKAGKNGWKGSAGADVVVAVRLRCAQTFRPGHKLTLELTSVRLPDLQLQKVGDTTSCITALMSSSAYRSTLIGFK